MRKPYVDGRGFEGGGAGMREALLHLPIPADEVPPSGQAVQEVACRNLPSDTGQIFRSVTHGQKLWSYMLHALRFPL